MNKSKIKDWGFSLFYNTDKGLHNCEPLQEINLWRLFAIYNSPHLATKSKELAIATDEQKEKIKAQLPYITPKGTFSYRNNASIKTYNSTLLPLDIDNLKSIDEAREVQWILSEQMGCVLSVVSPRGKGVKALFYLGSEIEMDNHYTILKEGIPQIAKYLDIEQWESNIDANQFKLCQPFFIGYSEYSFFNGNANPTGWYIENIPKKIIEYKPPLTINYTPSTTSELMRIEAYINDCCNRLENLFSNLGEGERHNNIWKVRGISGVTHYAPHLTSSIKQRLFFAVVGMYKSEQEARNRRALKTFEDCWSNAPQVNNDIIEEIIKDEQIKMSINLKSIEQ
jgi:hypothetical protein